jgi:hypothetical protein
VGYSVQTGVTGAILLTGALISDGVVHWARPWGGKPGVSSLIWIGYVLLLIPFAAIAVALLLIDSASSALSGARSLSPLLVVLLASLPPAFLIGVQFRRLGQQVWTCIPLTTCVFLLVLYLLGEGPTRGLSAPAASIAFAYLELFLVPFLLNYLVDVRLLGDSRSFGANARPIESAEPEELPPIREYGPVLVLEGSAVIAAAVSGFYLIRGWPMAEILRQLAAPSAVGMLLLFPGALLMATVVYCVRNQAYGRAERASSAAHRLAAVSGGLPFLGLIAVVAALAERANSGSPLTVGGIVTVLAGLIVFLGLEVATSRSLAGR